MINNGMCVFKGRIDLDELIGAFKKLGIGIDRTEAENLLRR